MQTNFVFTGVDVSKDELVIGCLQAGGWQKAKVRNDLEVIGAWLDGFGVAGKSFVLESTGTYSDRLVHALHQRRAVFSVVSPAQSRAMSGALLKTNKNDDQDAQTLSLLGEKLQPKPYHMPTGQQKKRAEALSALGSLQKQAQQLHNQLHAFEYRVEPNPVAVGALKKILQAVQEQIQALEKEASPQQGEEDKQGLVERIGSIKGVGRKTAQTFVAYFGDFSVFQTAKQFGRFVGLSPSEFTSGKSVRQRPRITKKGRGKLRALLFNCARSAMQHNPTCKELYQRIVAKGKNGALAFTAVMHKLARIIFGVARSGQNYDPNYHLNKQKVLQSLA